METTLILALLGVLFGIIAIVLHFAHRISIAETGVALIQEGMKDVNKTNKEMLKNSRNVLEIAKSSAVGEHPRQDLTTFLAHQWQFIEKTFKNRFEKHDISKRIVQNHIPEKSNILLDSGSTIDLVTFELLGAGKNANVHTNNVFAAMHLVGTHFITLHLLDGLFNDRFAATYSAKAVSRIDVLGINVFILAATAFRFRQGIMVHREDGPNKNFKAEALRVFRRRPDAILIVAVDASKFLGPPHEHVGVISEERWRSLLEERAASIVLVTAPLRPEAKQKDIDEIDEQIREFESLGVTVDRI